MDYERFNQLTEYTELLLKVTKDAGFKLNHEINMAIKQLEREMQLDGSSYIVVQNGEILIKNCVFNPKEDEYGISLDGDKLSLNGIKVQDKNKVTFTGNTAIRSGKGIYVTTNPVTDEYIEELIEQGKLPNGHFKEEILLKLKDWGITLEFNETGIRWFRTIKNNQG